MIRQTLTATKAATFLVRLREPGQTEGMFMPAGTGFFVSPDGYFITAHHVVEWVGRGEPVVLSRPPDYYMGDDNAPPLTPENQRHFVLLVVSDVQIVQVWPVYDLALLKADFEKNKQESYWSGYTHFSYIVPELGHQEEGTPVYAFGFPLIDVSFQSLFLIEENGLTNTPVMVEVNEKVPTRVTSAIISSTREHHGSLVTQTSPRFYVIDKALNYGNSGGPIVLTETGRVIAVCVRFQPVAIAQGVDPATQQPRQVVIPFLYSVTTSLRNIASTLTPIIAGLPSGSR